jgi:hypothetical protein
MNEQQARDLVEKTFEADFDREQFGEFISQLLKSADFSKATGLLKGQVITRAFQEKIRSYERIAQFTDVDGNKIDILIVNLRKDSTLERGRTSLRNFAADYLQTDRGLGKAAVLVAYAVKTEKGDYAERTEWRFSYATLEKSLVQQESGKFKERLTRQLPAHRYSFLVGPQVETYTAKKQFLDLLKSQSAPTLAQIEEAFSVEKVTDDFYKEYEKLFKLLEKEIGALRRKDKTLEAHLQENCIENADFAKKLLGQIAFLYFLQRKGWFGVPPDGKYGEGDKRYLRKLFNDRHEIAKSYSSYARKSKSFFNNILEPLFYEALAQPRHDANDVFDSFNSRIPFLNGGLFEPKYEYRKVHIELPDELFSNRDQVKNEEEATGILDVFDRYNFTVNEAERLEKEVAIDPEMLGHVFENLLVKEERGQSGTFYTPQIIVNYMCRQSLLEYICTNLLEEAQQTIGKDKLTRADLEDFIASAELMAEYETKNKEGEEIKVYKKLRFPQSIRERAPDIDEKLKEVKVCDPAIGSGAFPVGLLQEIVRLRLSLLRLLERGIEQDKDKSERQKTKELKELHQTHTPFELKLYAIENSIYGVDKEQSAVDIARLRLWLSLIVDEEDLSEDKSLPNLDYKIAQGNSLLNEFRGLELIPDDFVVKHSAQPLLPNEDLNAQLQKLYEDYVAEAQSKGTNSIEAKRLSRCIDELKVQIKKRKEKPKSSSPQGDLLKVEGTGKEKIKQLHAIHQDIFKSKEKREKDRLRREADRIILEFINEHLTEENNRLEDLITKTREELKKEKANVRRSFKDDRVTPKIKALSRDLEGYEERLAKRKESQLALKNLWQKREGKKGISLDLTDIADDNFTTVKAKDFMLWELQFVEMFFSADGNACENGGFDIVIANPPYIRSGKLSKEHKEAFSRRYQTYDGNADIYVYFYEKSLDVLQNEATLTFITSNSFLNSGFGAKLRHFLKSETKVEKIIDFAETGVFDATVETCIIKLVKMKGNANRLQVLKWDELEPLENLSVTLAQKSFFIKQAELRDESWQLEQPEILRLLEKLKTRGTALSDYVENKFYYGIKTGFNEAFVVNGVTKDELVAEHKSSAEVLKPFLRGRDVRRWQVEPQDLWLIFVPWHFPLHEDVSVSGASKRAERSFAKSYPAIYKHLSKYKPQLSARNRSETGIRYEWYALQRWASDYWQEFEKPKIVYQDIARYFGMAWDDSGSMLANTCYFIPTNEKWLLGVLLSSTIRFWVKKFIGSDEGGFIRLFSIHVGKFPIPPAEDWQKEIIEKLVDYIILLTKTDGEKLIVNYFESIINGCVYEVFLPEELHTADKRFFELLRQENLPDLSEHAGSELQIIRELFEQLSNVDHPIRHNLYFLSNLESVRIIEGK